ncbi:hypothetical protein QBC37DRAFT_114626 [Rhypophila decipiens]|uniref:Uncharacterized protein n=1 Tax=Rhypophila decipiens TaxID=261697 RepID=A0AAN7B9U0_9PEZI|nr:hypothetical protein QBC37DRAFT_114626 [Rhypophila decipiens]
MSGPGGRLAERIGKAMSAMMRGGAAVPTKPIPGASTAAARKGARKPVAPPPPPTPPVSEAVKWKAGAISVSFFIVIVTGAWYGATLKTDMEVKEKKQKALEMTADESIAILEQRRTHLNRIKTELEQKIAMLQARRNKDTVAMEEIKEKDKNKPAARPLNWTRGSQ